MANMNAVYRQVLEKVFVAKTSRNSKYSLRAFARFLDCDPSYLSKLNSGKLILSVDLADQFSKKLKLSEKERRAFILSAAEEQKCHALYLLDPSLTDCDEEKGELNLEPKPRKHKVFKG